MRSAEALHRLCFTLAVGTLYLTSQGTQVVAEGHRRRVDAHWFRGNSYFRIGWEWVKHALSKGWALLTSLQLAGGVDPDPAIASRRQDDKRRQKLDGFGSNALIYNE